MRTITLEEHFLTQNFAKATGAHGPDEPPAMQEIGRRLLDLGEGRLAAMDEAGIDVQVLSLEALALSKLHGDEATELVHDVHDEVAAAVKQRPERLQAFATPNIKAVPGAVKEIERCVRELKFPGVMLDGTSDGKFLDAPEFFPVLEAIEALNVPLYIHPALPPQQVADVYFSGLPGEVGHLLSIAGWGWHAETGLHILRLIASGVLDRLPRLKVIIGHMGEGVPYALARSSSVLSRASHLKRSVEDTFKQQVWVTTSGYFTRPPFECARTVLGLDRLMFSVDYPFSPTSRGAEFLSQLQLTPDEDAAFRGGTAAKLLGI